MLYVAGTTVRLQCKFYDFDKNLIDPARVKLIIYDSKYTKINEFENVVRVSEGTYQYDYVSESTDRRLYYEFYGEIAGNPAINRQALDFRFD